MIIILLHIYCSTFRSPANIFIDIVVSIMPLIVRFFPSNICIFFFIEKDPHEISIVANLNKCALSDL